MDANYLLEGQIANLAFLENLYQQYQNQPGELDSSWPHFFEKLERGKGVPSLVTISPKNERITNLAEAYRKYGHLLATINPIAFEEPKEPEQLNLEKLGFRANEKEELFPTLGLLEKSQAPLKEIVSLLKTRYSRTIGFEYKGFTDPNLESWMQQQIESGDFDKPLNHEEKRLILDLLTRAELLETFLQTKHVGKKRFSLEGAETLIPMLAFLITKGAEEGTEEIFIGMSHRGRLNVLANILNKPIASILNDFEEDYEPAPSEGMGDIRYHKGHTNEAVKTYLGTSIKLTMAPNPSHLESVNPVIEGQTHAKQFLVGDESERRKIIPLLMHGDAALSGQGIVYETMQMGKLSGFETGGTLHIVINNQIGFTTNPEESRSTLYCTDIARTFGAPVFHVNAEDPESCIRVTLLALKIRQRFHCDVFIDLNCYRKYGHNEGDEPAFTQPVEYQMIRKKETIRALYLKQLMHEGLLDKSSADEQEEKFKEQLQEAYSVSQEQAVDTEEQNPSDQKFDFFQTIDTKVDSKLLHLVVEHFSQIPQDFHVHPKLEHLIKERTKAVLEDKPFDWGMAETLAYGSLVWEGIPVRLAGQDSERGTFSHRHALWVDQVNNHAYYPLAHLREGQGRFEVLNTSLSEAAALGFEYGYSTVCLKCLTIWEAQFGDFANSAQVIIDQYIASGEEKWGQTSNLVLFLPHGFEGQGPEHSSARFERFLSLAGHDNMQIANPTTPAQLFHLLRRQIKQPWRKPLVILTPKGLLRHPDCVSHLSELTHGQFYPILDDPRQPEKVRRLILCSGRIYYDLDAHREKEKRHDLAIIRLEQLYPLDTAKLKSIIASYGRVKDCQWVQEEPENMGAWSFVSFYLPQLLPRNVPVFYVGRERSATPATGFYSRHKQELANILYQVFQT
jgi:2-oxoglutarate dehydrogenase E1 component